MLESAKEDLIDGYHFYEEQAPGLGTYFFDSLFSDIDSLALYAGIHRKVFARIARCPSAFRLRSITTSLAARLRSMPFSIAGGGHRGFACD